MTRRAEAEPHDPPRGARRLVAADSFRVRLRSGRAEVRGAEHHGARFTSAVHEASRGAIDAHEVRRFLTAAVTAISDFGAGFPRLELWETRSGELELRTSLRELPTLGHELSLVSAPGVALETPERKGPNLERLASLGQRLGAEPLLIDDTGAVREGASTAIIWWDGARGHVVRSQARVASVCERIISDAAARAGAPLTASGLPATHLIEHEVWAVNALHGIRVVRRIDGVDAREPDAPRLARFRGALDRSWQSVIALAG